MQVVIALTDIEDVKKDLGLALPEVKSSHRVEALARGLGWRTNATMRAELSNGAATREISVQRFVEYLAAHGFKIDGRLFTGTMLRVAIRAVMKARPVLTAFGFGVYDEQRLDFQERKNRYDEERQEMLTDSSAEQFERACEYLMQVKTRTSVNRDVTSYGLKHRAERYHSRRTGYGYVSNGMFLAAAYHLRFKVQRASKESPNGYLNISSASLKTARRPRTLPSKTEGQPFRILGHDRGTYFYWLDEQERVVRLPGGSHSARNLLRLAPVEYWASRYPSSDRRAQFNRWHAVDALFRGATEAGIFANDEGAV